MFSYSGELSVSKSWYNRALILSTWDSELKIIGDSQAEDVVYLKNAITDFLTGKTEFNVGQGGTTFRFLAVRVSRKPGSYFLKIEQSLLKRPHQELLNFFKQVGVEAEFTNDGLKIVSKGWQIPELGIVISAAESSQFISAILLSSLKFEKKIQIRVSDTIVSEGYLTMTLNLLNQANIKVSKRNLNFAIEPNQSINTKTLTGELDMSSAFTLACCAAIAGQIEIFKWPAYSIQPDVEFLNIFEKIGIQYSILNGQFNLKMQNKYRGIKFDIRNCPDLFPVLSALLSFAERSSELFGADQLKHKESNRLSKTSELLKLCQIKHEIQTDGILIYPSRNKDIEIPQGPLDFDCEHDHRMVMAACFFKLKGYPLHIKNVYSINKSYPEFLTHIGLSHLVNGNDLL